jgi:hypothetical protein
VLARPEAFFILLCALVLTAWSFDYTARVQTAAMPSGSFQSPQAQVPPESLPFIPTHARLEFPVGQDQARAVGSQENIWNWNTVVARVQVPTPSGQQQVGPFWYISLVFLNQTRVGNIIVHTINTPGRSLPIYHVIQVDARTAFMSFQGDLSGFSIDITNQP